MKTVKMKYSHIFNFSILSTLVLSLFTLQLYACETEEFNTSFGQEDSLEIYLSRIEKFGFSGSVLVEKNNQIILHNGYGRIHNEKINADTKFPIASLTKQFTAALVLLLETEGKIEIEDSLSHIFPKLKNKPKGNITIRQLMSHTSGLIGEFGTNQVYSKEQFLKGIFDSKLNSTPGEKYAYSNAGYNLLAIIIEKTTGTSFQSLMLERIFIPLKMKDTGFISEDRDSFANSELTESWNVIGASGIYSTTKDLLLWVRSLNDTNLLSSSALKKYFEPQKKNYALGWKVSSSKRFGKVIHHGGDIKGYQSEIRWYVDQKVILIYLDNSELRKAVVNKILRFPLGMATYQPPIVTGDVKSIPHINGEYYFEADSSYLSIQQKGQNIALFATGQSAISAIQQMTLDERLKADSIGATGQQIWKKMSFDDYSLLLNKFTDRIPDASVLEYMKAEWIAFTEKHGAFVSSQLLGVSRSTRSTYYAYYILNFEKAEEFYRVEWSDGEIIGINNRLDLGNPEKEKPVFSKLYYQGDNVFVTYDLDTETTYKLIFDKDLKTVIFPNNTSAKKSISHH